MLNLEIKSGFAVIEDYYSCHNTATSTDIITPGTQMLRWEEKLSDISCKVISSDPHVSDRENETLRKNCSCGAWEACQLTLVRFRLRANKDVLLGICVHDS